jgi:hypothetical protein
MGMVGCFNILFVIEMIWLFLSTCVLGAADFYVQMQNYYEHACSGYSQEALFHTITSSPSSSSKFHNRSIIITHSPATSYMRGVIEIIV